MNDNDMISIRTMQESDIPQILKCLDIVMQSLCSRELFVAPSPDYIKTIIDGYGKTAGAYINNHLVGFASIVFPHKGRNNLGHILEMDEDSLLSVVQFEHTCVLPMYRGLGLAQKLKHFLLKGIPSNYTIQLSTISPKNIQSLSAAFKMKQEIVALKTIYNLDRYIMFRNIGTKQTYYQKTQILIEITNIKYIDQVLNQGYVGISFDKTKAAIVFVKDGKAHETISNKH